jgi:HSP20 family protein
MANKKSSFFQILTGAAHNEEENQEAKPGETQKATEVFSTPEITIKEEEETPKPKKEEAEDEAEAQPEGQLTVDVYQTKNELVIRTPVAGVEPEDLDVEITQDSVKIKGKRIREEKVETDNYYHQELYWGSFSRSVILPVEVEADRAEAALKNGILTIRLPKAREQSKKLKIKTI